MSQMRIILPVLFYIAFAACNKPAPDVPVSEAGIQANKTNPGDTGFLTDSSSSESDRLFGASGGSTVVVGTTELEVRIPFALMAEGQAQGDMPDCSVHIPFAVKKEDGRTLIEGEKKFSCSFDSTPRGQPISFHIRLEMEGILNGEILPPTVDKPAGLLDAFLNVEGTISQHYTGYPPQATNPCPASSPCRTEAKQLFPLPMEYREGSRITKPWTFILHLPH